MTSGEIRHGTPPPYYHRVGQLKFLAILATQCKSCHARPIPFTLTLPLNSFWRRSAVCGSGFGYEERAALNIQRFHPQLLQFPLSHRFFQFSPLPKTQKNPLLAVGIIWVYICAKVKQVTAARCRADWQLGSVVGSLAAEWSLRMVSRWRHKR